jgi:adenylate cyclase
MSGLSFFYTYFETKKAIKSLTENELKGLASVAAAAVNADVLLSIKPGDDGKPAYLSISDMLYKMQMSNRDIKYIYIYTHNDPKRVKFLVDAEYGHGMDVAKAGEIYNETTPAMMEGLNQAAAEDEFDTDKWGTFLSGYAPIKDKNGKSFAAVGVDMLAAKVIEKQNFIGDTVYIIIAIGIVVSAILITLISIPMIRDIKMIDTAAKDIVKGCKEITVKVTRNDEIGELADSIRKLTEFIGRKIK